MKFTITLFVLTVSPVYSFAPHLTLRKPSLLLSSHQEIFDAEEAAAFDAHDLGDPAMEAAAMERAVMMANSMVRKKRTELESKTQDTDAVQKQYVMLKKAAVDLVELFKSYEKDPKAFRKDFASKGKDESALAIEMLETVIAETADAMLDLEREEAFLMTTFNEAIEREELAEAKLAKARALEDAASMNLRMIEDFGGDYEADERRRELNLFHAGELDENLENKLESEAIREEHEILMREYDLKKDLRALKAKEQALKQDIKEIEEIVRQQLREEWESNKMEA